MRIWAEVRVLGMDRLRGKREDRGGQSRGRDSNQAGSDTAIGARMSGTIGSSGG